MFKPLTENIIRCTSKNNSWMFVVAICCNSTYTNFIFYNIKNNILLNFQQQHLWNQLHSFKRNLIKRVFINNRTILLQWNMFVQEVNYIVKFYLYLRGNSVHRDKPQCFIVSNYWVFNEKLFILGTDVIVVFSVKMMYLEFSE